MNENITLSMRNEALIFCFLSVSDEETESLRKQCGSEFRCYSSSALLTVCKRLLELKLWVETFSVNQHTQLYILWLKLVNNVQNVLIAQALISNKKLIATRVLYVWHMWIESSTTMCLVCLGKHSGRGEFGKLQNLKAYGLPFIFPSSDSRIQWSRV